MDDFLDIEDDGGGLGVVELAMGLGLGEEMIQEDIELARLAQMQREDERKKEKVAFKNKHGQEVVSIRTRRIKTRSLSEFQTYVEAHLNGEIDFSFDFFNEADPLHGKYR